MKTGGYTTMPTLIAGPLHQSESPGGQQKDLLRIAFENLMGLLGAVVVGDLLDELCRIEASDEPTEEQATFLDRFQGEAGDELLASLRNIGLEQMSLGKWVNLLRTMVAFTETLGRTPELAEALAVYPSCKKEIDELVRLRNEDAHGPATPPDRLPEVIATRRKMLDKILSACGFLADWHLVHLEGFEIEGGRQVFQGVEFRGVEAGSCRLDGEGRDFPVSQPLLVHASGRWVDVSPLAIVAPMTGGGGLHAAIFSKEIKGDPGRLSFVGAEAGSTVDVDDWTERHGEALASRRRILRRLFRAPAMQSVSLDTEMKLDAPVLKVGEPGVDLRISIANRKDSAELEEVTLVVTIPECVAFDASDDSNGEAIDERRRRFALGAIHPGGRIESKVGLVATRHGDETIPSALLEYRYRRSEDSVELDAQNAEEIEGVAVQSIDPAFEDPIRPIVNVERAVVPAASAQEIHIGDRFEFELRVRNVGLGRAESIRTVILPSDGLVLADGDREVTLDLAPGAEKVLRWNLRAERHGIHQIRVSDVVYRDLDGEFFITECSEERQFLVRADKRKQLEFAVIEVVGDLVVSEEESTQITALVDGLAAAIPDDAERERIRASAESEAVIRIVRGLVEETFRGREGKLRQVVHHENSWQERYHPDHGRRKVLGFFYDDFAVFAIDITEAATGAIAFHSLPVPGLTDRPPFTDDPAQGVFPGPRVLNGSLDHRVAWAEIRSDESRGVRFFKQWLARLAVQADRELLPWRQAANAVAACLGGRAVYQRRRFELVLPETALRNGGLDETGGSVKSRLFTGVVVPEPSMKGHYLVGLLPRSEKGSGRVGTKWLAAEIAGGRFDGLGLYGNFKEGADLEPATSGKFLVGRSCSGEALAHEDAGSALAASLLQATREAYLREVADGEATSYRKSGRLDVFTPERRDAWWTEGLDSLGRAGVVVRTTEMTRGDVRGTLEFVRVGAGPAGGDRVLARLVSHHGAAVCWLNWFDGMPSDLPVLERLRVDPQHWSVVEKVPAAINPGFMFRVGDGPLDDEAMKAFLEGVVAAAAGGEPRWPNRFRAELMPLVESVEPRLSTIRDLLGDGECSIADLQERAGDEARKVLLAANRLGSWRNRYDKPSPVRVDGERVSMASWLAQGDEG